MKIFKLEHIDGFGRCDRPYLIRFIVFSTKILSMYFHKFCGNDWTKEPHDHPKWFVSVGLKGRYIEEVYNKEGLLLDEIEHKAPWIRYFQPEHIHRVKMFDDGKPCYTLVFVGRKIREWGFYYRPSRGICPLWVKWDKYVHGHYSFGKEDC